MFADDKTIIKHFFERDERAVSETSEKYGTFLYRIAEKILSNKEDAEECTNETYLKTWDAIPPQRPKVFPAFLGTIVRNISFDHYSMTRAEKRGGGVIDAVLDELAECIPDTKADVECDEDELKKVIDSFVRALPDRNRKIFVMRYWSNESVSTIAGRLKMSENSVSAVLTRIRKKMKKYLAERGFEP